MNIPVLTAYAEKDNRLEKFENSIRSLQEGIAKKHIWNVDYEDAKYRLNSVWEKAEEGVYAPLRSMYYHASPRPADSWDSNDPRRGMGLIRLIHAAGNLKKFEKVKNAPELKPYLELLAEGAECAALLVAAKPFIEKGRKPAENPVEKDYTNTGICPVCMRRQKLTMTSLMVAHGYQLERNWGGRVGNCFGVGYKAWELSPDGAIAYKENMERILAHTEEELGNLITGAYDSFTVDVRIRKGMGQYATEKKTYHRDTEPEAYKRVLERNISDAEQEIRFLHLDIDEFKKRIASWKEHPLMYGGAETQKRWKSKFLNK